ncbi:MAG: hypothetical protein Q8Q08_10660 [Candidatus Omnitrophota bacterium]|nr:hypothetical protein [Candidatus Omnitrophota bacterium]MDZ4241500.1 DUF6798 domain-containing protein [Candidatus Omnitrophota bacterium]
MNNRISIPRILASDWVIAAILLAVFLLANGYTYAWDDQHLEIPLLKKLINPSLYPNDYYVDSLARNFTSFLYPLLAKLISVDQVPAVYFVLYLLSRYFMFFWMHKLWRLLTGQVWIAAASVMTIILVGRVEEFLYRTFSHQELAMAVIFAGLYYFYKERFILAAFLLGLAANFHALYSLYPMVYVSAYLLWRIRQHGIRTLLQAGLSFVLAAAPLIIWVFQKYLGEGPGKGEYDGGWIGLYQLACPQNFTFYEIPLKAALSDWSTFFKAVDMYLVLAAFYLLNYFFSEEFRKDAKTQVMAACVAGFVVLSFLFSYVWPNPFMLDLNLVRNTQYLQFLLMGYTAVLVVRAACTANPFVGVGTCWLFLLIRYGEAVALLTVFLWICLLSAELVRTKARKNKDRILAALLILPVASSAGWGMVALLSAKKYSMASLQTLYGTTAVLAAFGVTLYVLENRSRWMPRTVRLLTGVLGAGLALSAGYCLRGLIAGPGSQALLSQTVPWMWGLVFCLGVFCLHILLNKKLIDVSICRKILIFIPLAALLINFAFYHHKHLVMERTSPGFWQLQRNWIDMQKYAKANTPRQAMFLVPNDMEMGGFRIFSERPIVVCYRDCGIIGFDYRAAVEWRRRLRDVESFKVIVDAPIGPAVMTALLKYKVNYIVSMRYLPLPENEIFEKIYENETFTLYRIKINPAL